MLHNHLVRLAVRCDQSWAQVEAQLQRRHDLVPNLVATVSAYAGHERAVLDDVADARARAIASRAPAERASAEDALGDALGRLVLLGEDHPELRADARFRHLQDELTASEDRIAFARGFANDRVARYRAATTTFPGVLVARALRFEDRPMFDAAPGTGTAPAVRTEG